MLADDIELLLHGERHLDRSPREQRKGHYHGLDLHIDFGAETASEPGGTHLDLVLGPAEQPCDLQTHIGRHLGRGVDGD